MFNKLSLIDKDIVLYKGRYSNSKISPYLRMSQDRWSASSRPSQHVWHSCLHLRRCQRKMWFCNKFSLSIFMCTLTHVDVMQSFELYMNTSHWLILPHEFLWNRTYIIYTHNLHTLREKVPSKQIDWLPAVKMILSWSCLFSSKRFGVCF